MRNYSDIDALASLSNVKPNSSATALGWVKSALEARFPQTEIVIRRPAVVVRFAGGYETWELIPGFLTGLGNRDQFVYEIPAPGSITEWIYSAPKEHLSYVNSCNITPHKGDAKALARLLKAWKYFCSVPVSSFYLEMRAAQYVARQTSYVHVFDLCGVLEDLVSHSLADMNDPKRTYVPFQSLLE